jgi:hypothetical protein
MYTITAGMIYGETVEFDIVGAEGYPLTSQVIEDFRAAVFNTITDPVYRRPFVEISEARHRSNMISTLNTEGEVASSRVELATSCPQFECKVASIPKVFDLRRSFE